MGKTVLMVVGLAAAVAIAVFAPPLGAALAAAIGVSTAVATALVTVGLSIALSVAMSFAYKALGVGAPSAKDAVGPPVVFRQSISNSFIIYGKRRVGGLLVFFHGKQDVSGSHFRYFVIAVAGHRCQGVVNWRLGDEIVTVDGSHMVTSGKYANAAWLWFQRGLSSETANATFVSECDGQWTTDHKGNDTAAIYAKFELTDAVIQAGMPNITADVEGRDEILDSRTATTGYTRNAALIFYDWMSIPREEGGFGAYTDEIPDDDWISAQANVCDETVNSNARYAFDAVITTGASPADVRDAMIVNCAGTYTFSGGKHLMRPGYWVPVTAVLEEDDLAGPIQVTPFLTSDAAANEVQGTYISPNDNYQGAPFTTQTTTIPPTDIRQLDVDLAFTTVKDQADRVARIMLNRAQAEKAVMWPGNINLLSVRALDTAQANTTRYGLSNYAFSVSSWGLSPDWGVILSLREENAEIYDPPTVVAPVTPPTVSDPDPVLPVSQITDLISRSYPTDLTFKIDDTGHVHISDHDRNYSDKVVSVEGLSTDGGISATRSGSVAGGGAAGDVTYVFYDDPPRAGGAVTYQHLTLAGGVGDDSSAYASSANPYRHFVCAGHVPTAGTSTNGGSTPGDGGGVQVPAPGSGPFP
jgi:hypothetical protein